MAVLSTELNSDAEFWWQICKPALAGLMNHAGTYTPQDKDSNLQFFRQQIAPWIGPRPRSQLGQDASPLDVASPVEMSINFTSTGKPIVRYQFEPLGATAGPHTTSEDPFGKARVMKLLGDMESLPGVDLRWVHQFLQAMTPSDPEEVAVVNKAISDGRLPFPLDHHITINLAFDLSGSKTNVKAYFFPLAKHFSTGKTTMAVTFDTIRALEPHGAELAPSVNQLERYWPTCPDKMDVTMVGTDAADPSKSRIKLYAYINSLNSWNVVKHICTLGGVAVDKERLQGLEILHSVWPLLMDEDEGREDLDDYNKPLRLSISFLGSLLFSFEFRPGYEFPDVKTYVPQWQYGPSDRKIAQNLVAIFRRLGWEKAAATYIDKLQETFPGADLDGPASLHSNVSFSYSPKTGGYMSVYYAVSGKSVIVSKPNGVQAHDGGM